MTLSDRTKNMALGGAIGAAGVAIAVALFGGHRSPEHRPMLAPPRYAPPSPDENARGQYGKKKQKRRHRRHSRG